MLRFTIYWNVKRLLLLPGEIVSSAYSWFADLDRIPYLAEAISTLRRLSIKCIAYLFLSHRLVEIRQLLRFPENDFHYFSLVPIIVLLSFLFSGGFVASWVSDTPLLKVPSILGALLMHIFYLLRPGLAPWEVNIALRFSIIWNLRASSMWHQSICFPSMIAPYRFHRVAVGEWLLSCVLFPWSAY